MPSTSGNLLIFLFHFIAVFGPILSEEIKVPGSGCNSERLEGLIRFPMQGQQVNSNNCSWNIGRQKVTTRGLELQLSLLGGFNCSGCECGSMQIYNANGSLLFTSCNSTSSTMRIAVPYNRVTVNFTYASSARSSGFLLAYAFFKRDRCGASHTHWPNRGVFCYQPEGGYLENTTCTWRITAHGRAVEKTRFSFTALDIPSCSFCNCSGLTFWNRNGPVETFCNDEKPLKPPVNDSLGSEPLEFNSRAFESPGNDFLLSFSSINAGRGNGFCLQYVFDPALPPSYPKKRLYPHLYVSMIICTLVILSPLYWSCTKCRPRCACCRKRRNSAAVKLP